MFDAIGDMPLHPLVIHAVVVGIPLTLLLALLFAVPRFRAAARWPLAIVAVGSAVVTLVAKESGEGLQRVLEIVPGNPVGDLIQQHSSLADQLSWMAIAVAVVAVVTVLLVGRGPSRPALDRVLPLLLIVASVLATIWVVRVGDIGSRAVWNPTGDTVYTTSE